MINPAEALAAGRSLRVGGYAAIDFETATRFPDSACALGVAVVDNGQIVAIRRWLIRPPDNSYEDSNVGIHGITPEMTATAPGMVDVWAEAADLIGPRSLVAHNASFDVGVLHKSLACCGADAPDVTSFCTVRLARRTWPGWPSYRLPDVAAACGIVFSHHQPDADARAAAEIAMACCGAHGASDLISLTSSLNSFSSGRDTSIP